MSQWPFIPEPVLVTVHTMSIEGCLGTRMYNEANTGLTGTTSSAWPSSNLAIFEPFAVTMPTIFSKLFLMNGATISGNVDLGVYSMDGTRIVSAGSTAQSGAGTLQVLTVSTTTIGPGTYYMAMAADNGTASYFKGAVGQVLRTRVTGCAQMATAFPLPATATFAIVGQDYIPLIGLSTRNTI